MIKQTIFEKEITQFDCFHEQDGKQHGAAGAAVCRIQDEQARYGKL